MQLAVPTAKPRASALKSLEPGTLGLMEAGGLHHQT